MRFLWSGKVAHRNSYSSCILEDEQRASRTKKLGEQGRGRLVILASQYLRIKCVTALAHSWCSIHVSTATICVHSF